MSIITIEYVTLEQFKYIVVHVCRETYTGQTCANPGWGTVYVPR